MLKGFYLQDMTWLEAEQILSADRLVLIPLGAGAKEHGPHLRLDNDARLADYFARRVAELCDVVITPTVTFGYYPAFVDYPGSTHLRLETARDLMIDVCRSLARFGSRKFYVLNTGVSTVQSLAPAAAQLGSEGVLLHFTNILTVGGPRVQSVEQQEGGTHADEIETSMMLYIDASRVDMRKAVRDYQPGKGPLRRTPSSAGIYSPSGVFGDATLATHKKGAIIVEAVVTGILRDIEQLRAKVP
jgi:creatinine amidohydrolase